MRMYIPRLNLSGSLLRNLNISKNLIQYIVTNDDEPISVMNLLARFNENIYIYSSYNKKYLYIL